MYRKYIKRLLDIIISLILILILWPIMLITALLVLIDLGRPLFNEIPEREGLNKKTFRMYKFRTKIIGSNSLDYDKRYTKVSKFLDKYRFNELPQLFNILKGDMSLIGPRPFIPGEKLPEGEISPKRYLVRPGVTGLAQATGSRTMTHKQKLSYDEPYYDNLTFINDVKIVFKTVGMMIKISKFK